MDTTAAAELGLGVVGPGVDGVGFLDGGSAAQEAWPDDDYEQIGNVRNSEPGGWGKETGRRAHGRQGRPPFSGSAPSYKRMRSVSGDVSGDQTGGQAYGGRPDSGGYGAGTGYIDFSAPNYTVSEDEMGFQGSRANSSYGGGLGGGSHVQGNMRGNSYSGDYNSGLEPPTPASSGGPGSISGSITGKGKGTGSIFFKTKLCSKFRAGTCPYNSNCNFAHGMEELRKPPPGWEEIVAAQEAERALRGREGPGQPNFSNQGPGGAVDAQRFHKTRPCKKYYTDEGCPYGERCNFLHDDQASQLRATRESNAISLGPTTSTGNNSGGSGANGAERPSNWKTRICNKWETTGHCPFGQKCHFAHGFSDGHLSAANSRHGVVATSIQIQRQVVKTMQSWKGPGDEISTIYGDWIEEDEWEHLMPPVKKSIYQSDSHLNDGKKDDKANQDQKTKQQTLQQPNVHFFRGNSGHNVSGKKQKNYFSVTSRDGRGQLHDSPNESFYGNGGLYEDDGWDGEL